MTPSAAASPNAEPPQRQMAWTRSTSMPGRSRSVSLVPGAEPRTSTPAVAPSSGSRTTVQPVRASASVQCPTRTPRTSVMNTNMRVAPGEHRPDLWARYRWSVARHADVDADGLVDFARALVRVPSVNDPAAGRSEAPAAALVAERLRHLGWSPLVEEAAPGRPNVIAVVEGGRAGPTLLLGGHADVGTEG